MVKTLYSKRNRVLKLGKIVCKTVKSKELARGELLRLRLLRKKRVEVPKVLGQLNNNIFLKYVDSQPLPDWLTNEALTKENLEQVAESLTSWLQSFYKAVKQEKTKIILQDVNCRNFLVCKAGDIYGVDFEAFAQGSKEENIGEIIAFISNYDLNDKNKRIFAQHFFETALQKLNLDKELVLKNARDEQERMEKRRENRQTKGL